jgi:hypothetical protein
MNPDKKVERAEFLAKFEEENKLQMNCFRTKTLYRAHISEKDAMSIVLECVNESFQNEDRFKKQYASTLDKK